MLDDLGIGPALRAQTKEFSMRTGMPISLNVEGPVDSIPEQYRTCLYRVVQEALTNCARHAEANQVVVKLQADERCVWVSIEDDGKGFETDSPSAGFGLTGMCERISLVGGQLELSSSDGGTTVEAVLPSVRLIRQTA